MPSHTHLAHTAFRISLILKGAFATAEVAASIFSYVVEPQEVFKLVKIITETELTSDPHDFVANHLIHAAQHLSVGAQHFAAFYLLSHGIVKLWLIAGLWHRKAGLTCSPFLIVITLLDGIVIWLTYVEYRQLHSRRR